jgi:hypothetical protein
VIIRLNSKQWMTIDPILMVPPFILPSALHFSGDKDSFNSRLA